LFWSTQERAALTLQRCQRGHVARSSVREFLNKKAAALRNSMATNIQRVYRGHLSRISARSEKNKLQAQYNMAWLTTYTEQLSRIAKVEHWDVFEGRVENIAHRVRDLYASFEMEHNAALAAEKGGSTRRATKGSKKAQAKPAVGGDAVAVGSGGERGVGVVEESGEEGEAVVLSVTSGVSAESPRSKEEEEEEEGAPLTIEELQEQSARAEEEKLENEREHHAAAAIALASLQQSAHSRSLLPL
jgi:hypothetical protein